MDELYIYYRVAADRADAFVPRALALQARLRARHSGLHTALLRRPGTPASEPQTWMEIYARPPAGVDATLETQIEEEARAELGAWIEGMRKTERFECVSSR